MNDNEIAPSALPSPRHVTNSEDVQLYNTAVSHRLHTINLPPACPGAESRNTANGQASCSHCPASAESRPSLCDPLAHLAASTMPALPAIFVVYLNHTITRRPCVCRLPKYSCYPTNLQPILKKYANKQTSHNSASTDQTSFVIMNTSSDCKAGMKGAKTDVTGTDPDTSPSCSVNTQERHMLTQ